MRNYVAFAERKSKTKVYWQKNRWWIIGLGVLYVLGAVYISIYIDYKWLSIILPTLVTICYEIYSSGKKEKPNYLNEFERQFYNRIDALRKISDTSDSFISKFYELAKFMQIQPQSTGQ